MTLKLKAKNGIYTAQIHIPRDFEGFLPCYCGSDADDEPGKHIAPGSGIRRRAQSGNPPDVLFFTHNTDFCAADGGAIRDDPYLRPIRK